MLVQCRSSPAGIDPEDAGEDALELEDETIEAETPVELPPLSGDLPVSSLDEIWAYLISGNEEALKASYPLSDIGYFGAEVDGYGQLTGVPNRRKIANFSGRVHLVVCCNGRALTHFSLEPGGAVRTRLISDLLEAARPFDGLQIDFENVPARDGAAFRSFLGELRQGLGNKMFTIALPARTRTLADDVYDYRRIAPLVDRILVMAYDEHWSTSPPGPIASLDWCRSVASYSLAVIGPEKLIMGLPLYGRTWGSENTFRAFFHSGIERIKRENNVTEVRREKGIPTFTYEIPLTVTVYYEDEYSLSLRIEMYRAIGVKSIGFWRLGQETAAVWSLLSLTR
jgi:spore germination protein YaaH